MQPRPPRGSYDGRPKGFPPDRPKPQPAPKAPQPKRPSDNKCAPLVNPFTGRPEKC